MFIKWFQEVSEYVSFLWFSKAGQVYFDSKSYKFKGIQQSLRILGEFRETKEQETNYVENSAADIGQQLTN